MSKKDCVWCGGTGKRLDMEVGVAVDCTHCTPLRGVAVKKEVVTLDEKALAAKYADRVRKGKTQKDKQRKHKTEVA